jgi:hypothetical protein
MFSITFLYLQMIFSLFINFLCIAMQMLYKSFNKVKLGPNLCVYVFTYDLFEMIHQYILMLVIKTLYVHFICKVRMCIGK